MRNYRLNASTFIGRGESRVPATGNPSAKDVFKYTLWGRKEIWPETGLADMGAQEDLLIDRGPPIRPHRVRDNMNLQQRRGEGPGCLA